MKTNIRHAVACTIFVVGCILTTASRAQTVYEGQLLDNITELPMPAATVTLSKRHLSTQTNEQGYFKIAVDSAAVNEMLIFTSVGYKTFKLSASNYKPGIFIRMQPGENILKQINIKARKEKKVTLDRFVVSSTNFFHPIISAVMFGRNYKWMAKLFEAPSPGAKLENIKLGRDDFGNHLITINKFARFNLHVMAVDSVTSAPGRILFTKEINLQDNSHFVSIDLSKDNISLPSAKFFIAIEYFFIPYNEVVSMSTAPKVAGKDKDGEQVLDDTPIYYILYQPFLSISIQNHPATMWYKDLGDKWISGSTNKGGPNVSATLIY